jgi:hypothetical protein
MAKYRITDKTTGKTMVVSGEAPPTEADIEQLFASVATPATDVPPAPTRPTPPPSPSMLQYGNELTAGLARPIASIIDTIMSPVAVGYQLATGKPAMSASSMVAPVGTYAPNTLGRIIGLGGETAMSSLSVGQAGRTFVSSLLDDAARAGESAFRGVLRQLGSSKPADDVLGGFIAGASSEAAGAVAEDLGASPNTAQAVRSLAGLGAPVAAAPVLNRLTNRVNAFITKPGAVPTVNEIRGASRALYQQVEDLGIVFNEAATKRIVDDIQNIVTAEGLTTLRGETTLGSQTLKILKLLGEPGEFNGTSFSVLDKARSAFADIASGTDNEARIARQLRDAVDNFLLNPSVDDVAAVQASGGRALPSPTMGTEDKNAISRTLLNARALWRRAKSAEIIDDAFSDANVASLGAEGQNYNKVLNDNLRNLLRDPKYATQFSDDEKKQIQAVLQGGSVRRTFEAIRNLGISSDNYIKGALLTTAGAAAYGYSTPQAMAAFSGLIGTKVIAEASKVIASQFFKNDANAMRAIMRAGPNAQVIARTYLARTRPSERNPAELAVLFRNSGVDLSKLAEKPPIPSALVSDAVAFAQALEAMQNTAQAVEGAGQ